MPLNMNTVGTGSGVSNSGSGAAMVISALYDQLISDVYDQNITNIGAVTKKAGQSTSQFESDCAYYYKSTIYNKCFYDVIEYASYGDCPTTTGFYKYERQFVDSDLLVVETLIPTSPFTIYAGERTSVLQADDYVYIIEFTTQERYDSDTDDTSYWLEGFILRFDGQTFTEIFNGDLPNYLFGESKVRPGKFNSCQLITDIFPMTNHDVPTCRIELIAGYGFVGMFTIDDTGFHRITYHKLTASAGADGLGYYRYYNGSGLFSSETSFVHPAYNDSYEISLEKYEISYVLYGSSTPENLLYGKTFTFKSSTKLATNTDSSLRNIDSFFMRASYPLYDTYLLTCLPYKYGGSHSSDGRLYYSGEHWFQLSWNSGDWSVSKITINPSNVSFGQGDILFKMYAITNDTSPFIWIRRIGSEGTYYNRGYISYYSIDISSTYNSTKARYMNQVYLEVGDTVYCDDGIISVRTGSSITQVNVKTYKVTTAGDYEIITKVADAYTFPSFVITDKNGNIIYVRADKTSDTTINGYFLKGMKVNDSVVSSSAKQVYTNNHGRFKISMK